MIKRLSIAALFTLMAFSGKAIADGPGQQLNDDQIKKILINKSIASYSGRCPCPYNITSNGSRCGKRSAYSRKGGYAPKCYKSDISDQAVKAYKKTIKNKE